MVPVGGNAIRTDTVKSDEVTMDLEKLNFEARKQEEEK
jgi:hypothetical protein